MSKFGLKQNEIEVIKSVIKKNPEITKAAIFGSRALGNYKNGSDIDMVLFGNCSLDTVSRLKTRLEEETNLPYFFDIVHYETISNSELKKHIDEFAVELSLV